LDLAQSAVSHISQVAGGLPCSNTSEYNVAPQGFALTSQNVGLSELGLEWGITMTVSIEKLRQFQQQHLESQVQCGEEIKAVPKAGCVKEWALVEIALGLHALNEKLDRIVQQPGFAEISGRTASDSEYRRNPSQGLPRS
jgi:hypothetical protein